MGNDRSKLIAQRLFITAQTLLLAGAVISGIVVYVLESKASRLWADYRKPVIEARVPYNELYKWGRDQYYEVQGHADTASYFLFGFLGMMVLLWAGRRWWRWLLKPAPPESEPTP